MGIFWRVSTAWAWSALEGSGLIGFASNPRKIILGTVEDRDRDMEEGDTGSPFQGMRA